MITRLIESLAAAGKGTHALEMPDCTRVLLLPYGARILGLFAPEDGRNFYWTHAGLRNPATAPTVFPAEGWHNTGGDRTWVTPELDIFFPDYPDARRHWEPPQLDASPYTVSREHGGVRMSRTMALHLARPGREATVTLSKWIGPAPDPLRREDALESPVQYAGYAQHTTLELTDEAPVWPLGIWNLIQLPHGGDLLVPTYRATAPRVLFGAVPERNLVSEERVLRFRCVMPGEHKIAVRAADCTGRVGYVYRVDDAWALVIRNFAVQPSGEYVDVPKDDPDDLGYAVNAVSVLSGLGDFCEMEYHAAATGWGPEPSRSVDVSTVWAYRGAASAIDDVAARLLGVPNACTFEGAAR